MLQMMTVKSVSVSIGLSLALCVACGGGSSDSHPEGSAGSGSPAGSGGSNSPAGSGPGGSAPAGSSAGGSSAGSTAGSSSAGSSSAGSSSVAPIGGSGDFSSGLPGDKKLGTLTPEELAGLCQKLDSYFSDGPASKGIEELTCRFSSALLASFANPKTDAELQIACKSSYDTCIVSPTTTTETCTKPDASCTATAAEYDACVNATIKALGDLQKAFPSCDELTLASLGTTIGSGSVSDPPACASLKTKCPSAPSVPGSGD